MDFLREPLRPRKAKNVKGGTAVKEQPGGDPNLDCKWWFHGDFRGFNGVFFDDLIILMVFSWDFMGIHGITRMGNLNSRGLYYPIC